MQLLPLAVLVVVASSIVAQQVVLDAVYKPRPRQGDDPDKWTVFNSTIKRVAVIGAGMSLFGFSMSYFLA